ncbi:hypothetical protein EQG41_18620 [Billgrantia azerbaijanica]|nr:hypothetical protein EQG41_18620 [Halomonas azerbaijanica]
MSYLKKSLLLAALVAAWSAGPLLAKDGSHVQSVEGMDVYMAALPEVMIKDHRLVEAERDGAGVPERHLYVTLADHETGQRIEDARVTALLQQEGQGDSFQPLPPTPLDESVTYGDLFSFPEAGAYRVQLRIDRPGKPTAVVGYRYQGV